MTASAPIRKRRALIIDDSATSRAVVRVMLTAHHWETVEAADGEHGAELALRDEFDVVVCDHNMTGITGTQLCRILGADERTARVPIVVLTATSSRRGLFWAIESGASAYLAKSDISRLPLLLEQLEQRSTRISKVSLGQRGTTRSIAGRLGHLLDAALFESVLRTKVRGIATLESSLTSVVRRVGSLLGTLLLFRWCAVTLHGHREQLWLMCGDDAEQCEREALKALGLRSGVAIERLEEDLGAARWEHSLVERRPLMFGDVELGTIALAVDPANFTGTDEAVVDVIASELPAVIQLTLTLEQSRQHAMSDELTGIANRRAARDFLERSVVNARRSAQRVGVAIADIDHFKAINDKHGHDAGDVVLRAVAQVLSNSVRRTDFVARWGGEEFILVFPHTDAEGVQLVCERVRERVENLLVKAAGAEISASVSVGIAMLEEDGLGSLVRRADEALYQAKSRGRNRVVCAEQSLVFASQRVVR